jgi:hypothetical protein
MRRSNNNEEAPNTNIQIPKYLELGILDLRFKL